MEGAKSVCREGASTRGQLVTQKSSKSNGAWVRWNTEKAIRGFAWAPNSSSVSVLTTSGRLGSSPLELLAFASGHPVSHDTVSLSIWDIHTGTATEYLVRKNVVSSFTRILGWSR